MRAALHRRHEVHITFGYELTLVGTPMQRPGDAFGGRFEGALHRFRWQQLGIRHRRREVGGQAILVMPAVLLATRPWLVALTL